MISASCVFFLHFLSYNILLQEDCRASELTILKFRTWTSSFCFPVQFQNSLYFFWSSIGIEITTMLTLENMENFSSILISSLHCTFFFWSFAWYGISDRVKGQWLMAVTAKGGRPDSNRAANGSKYEFKLMFPRRPTARRNRRQQNQRWH